MLMAMCEVGCLFLKLTHPFTSSQPDKSPPAGPARHDFLLTTGEHDDV